MELHSDFARAALRAGMIFGHLRAEMCELVHWRTDQRANVRRLVWCLADPRATLRRLVGGARIRAPPLSEFMDWLADLKVNINPLV
jgi:hypothetical protein